MKKKLAVAAILGVAMVALAGPIKTWQAGEIITANDLNANFQHIHNLMVGGHGARLVNGDVSASAAISMSKLATPGLIPKAVAGTRAICDAGTCSWALNIGALSSTFTRASVGQYTLTFGTARSNSNYLINVAAVGNAANAFGSTYCYPFDSLGTSGFTVGCNQLPSDAGIAQPIDWPFTVTVYDDNN